MFTDMFSRIERNAGKVLAGFAALTALLVVPFLALAPTESASTEPGGDVFTARDRVDESFVSSVRAGLFIAESRTGDVLAAAPLRSLLATNDALRADPDIGPTLFEYFDAEVGVEVAGAVSMAELVDAELAANGGSLATATDEEVKLAGAALIDRLGESNQLLGMSAQSTIDADGNWVIPAVNVLVFSDNDVLGFGNVSVNLGGGTEAEEYDRSVRTLLRTNEDFQVDSVAIDVNLTSQEQGAVAGPFIGFTILAVLLIVGIIFRSYWVLATVSVALISLIIWLKGISNLLGLKDDLVLSLIVPVAMISFGVDFAFHSIGRYREERADGVSARPAYGSGLTAVSGALLLALTSGVAAFMSNVVSGIESIIQFGVGAAIALVSAYLLLGVVSPLVVARIEATIPPPPSGRRSTTLRLLGALGVASLTMASVLLLVFVLPWLGVVLAVVTVLVGLVVPFIVQRNRLTGPAVGDLEVEEAASAIAAPLGAVIGATSRRPWLVLPTALALSAVAAVFAVRVPAEFDVNDFFAPDTDFVVGLDQLDVHVGDRGGEPAVVYVEGDLTDPAALASLKERIDGVRFSDTTLLARDEDGVAVQGGVFSVFDAAWDSPVIASLVEEQTGVVITDADGNTIPDTTEQVEALYAVGSQTGIPLDAERLILTPDDVRTALALDAPGSADGVARTAFEFGLVNSRSQESVTAARMFLEPVAAGISDDLGGSFVQVTGSAFVREASLNATNDALQTSLPIALLLCFGVSSLFLRSVRYGLASIVPIVMVVSWLYAFMEIAGYSINIVTATIAAVSIGIGIDFAIHFIARYDEELGRIGDRIGAARAAGEGTGVALVASAFSSSVGFGILAFAPMPLFAAYGLLTALMIAMALTATLLVLPSILVVITADTPGSADVDADLTIELDGPGDSTPDDSAPRTPVLA